MKHRNTLCPFQIGEQVRYCPSAKGIAADIMSPSEALLTPGKIYRVEAIVDQMYVIVEGYRHPGGGLHWTEFEKVND